MRVISAIQPKTPHGEGWVFDGPVPPEFTQGYSGSIWRYPDQGLLVISAVEVASDPGDIRKGPEYHISASKAPYARVTRNEARFIKNAFGMDGAEEDNHVPGGVVRNFWMPVAENLIGLECSCKDKEPTIREDKGGFEWRGVTR